MGIKRKSFNRICRTVRRPFEWLLIWFGLLVVPPLSRDGTLSLAHWIANTVFIFDCRGKAVSRANLEVIFGKRMTARRAHALTRKAYRNMARVMVNIFWTSRDTEERLRSSIAITPTVIETLLAHQPAITVSAHLGNWEILSQACVLNGVPMMSVAQEIGTPLMARKLSEVRSLIGQQIVPMDGALRKLMQALNSGTSIGLLVDQHVHERDGGTWVKFCGLSVGISLAPATLSRRLKVPILFAWSLPLRDGTYLIKPGQLFLPDDSISDIERTQQLVTAFERVIKRHPSLWCLNYRRWRHILPGEDPAKYPYYARQLPDNVS